MLAQDEIVVITTMREHFHKSTDGDGELLWEAIKGQDVADVKRAIQEHRLEKGAQAWRPDIKRIASLACSYRNDRLRQRSREDKVIDWLRREANAKNDTRLDGLPNKEAILFHFSNCWLKLSEDDTLDGYGRQMARAFILSHATRAFREVGESDKDAVASARFAVDLADNETIRGGKMFRSLAPPPMPSEAIKALAEAAT